MGALEVIDAFGKWIDPIRPPFEIIDGELVETFYVPYGGLVREVSEERAAELLEAAKSWLKELLDGCDGNETDLQDLS